MDKPDYSELFEGKEWTSELLFKRLIVAIAKVETLYDSMIPVFAQAKGISVDEAEAKMEKRMAEYFSDQFTDDSPSNPIEDRE